MTQPLEYKVVSVSVNPSQWDALIGLAHEEGLTASAKIRQMVQSAIREAAKTRTLPSSKGKR